MKRHDKAPNGHFAEGLILYGNLDTGAMLIEGVERESASGYPDLEKVSVITGRFALLKKQNVSECSNEGHRPEREAQPPCDMKETEQDQDHPDRESG